MPDKSSDSFCELSVRRNVKGVETFSKQLHKFTSKCEELDEGGDREGGRVVRVQLVNLVNFKKVPEKEEKKLSIPRRIIHSKTKT